MKAKIIFRFLRSQVMRWKHLVVQEKSRVATRLKEYSQHTRILLILSDGWRDGLWQEGTSGDFQKSSMREPALDAASPREQTSEISAEEVSKEGATAQPPHPLHFRACIKLKKWATLSHLHFEALICLNQPSIHPFLPGDPCISSRGNYKWHSERKARKCL